MVSHACTCAPAGRRGLARGTGEPGAMFLQTSDLTWMEGKHHDAKKMLFFFFFFSCTCLPICTCRIQAPVICRAELAAI